MMGRGKKVRFSCFHTNLRQDNGENKKQVNHIMSALKNLDQTGGVLI